MNNITHLNITKFRHLENLSDIRLGEKITIIAGENGTGKSSLLGLIGHIFTYDRKTKKTIDNQLFETQFSEVFRFSPTKDVGGEHKYSLVLADGTIKKAESRFIEAENRFRIDVGERARGKGKIIKPVIYLGLKRLFPLAQEDEKKIYFNIKDNLTDEERGLFQEWHNRILVMEGIIEPKPTKTRNKEVYSPTNDQYDAFGNSAGQDNFAQIILAILSLKREYELVGESYPGGIILIDEVDATLYPAAQRNLIDLFLSIAGDFKIQIIFTTHSLDILRYVFTEKRKAFEHSCELVFFHRSAGKIKVIQKIDNVNSIIAELTHTVTENSEFTKKVNVYFEDNEARIFFRNIVNRELLKRIKIQRTNLGADSYASLIELKFPEFEKSIVVLDGDKSKKFRRNKQPKVLYLPGSKRPENVVLNFLSDLKEDHAFWGVEVGSYKKSVFNNNIQIDTSNRSVMKKWFNSEKIYWGKNCSHLFKRWRMENQKTVISFNDQLKKLLNKINQKLLPENK